MVGSLIDSRKTTWKEIGLSENNFKGLLHRLLVKTVQLNFHRMVKEDLTRETIARLANDTNTLINSGQITWKELGFTEDHFKEAVRQARVRDAKRSFKLIVRGTLPKRHLTKLASDVSTFVESGNTTWRELGFTEEDLSEALTHEKLQKTVAAS